MGTTTPRLNESGTLYGMLWTVPLCAFLIIFGLGKAHIGFGYLGGGRGGYSADISEFFIKETYPAE